MARFLLQSKWRAKVPGRALGMVPAAKQVACQGAGPGAWHGSCCSASAVPRCRAARLARFLLRGLLCAPPPGPEQKRHRAGACSALRGLVQSMPPRPCSASAPSRAGGRTAGQRSRNRASRAARHLGTALAEQQEPCQAPGPAPWHATCLAAGTMPSALPGTLARHLLCSRNRAKRPPPPDCQRIPCQWRAPPRLLCTFSAF